jgi:hypothetical protein
MACCNPAFSVPGNAGSIGLQVKRAHVKPENQPGFQAPMPISEKKIRLWARMDPAQFSSPIAT